MDQEVVLTLTVDRSAGQGLPGAEGREKVRVLERAISESLDESGLGSLDGHGFCDGRVEIFLYGPDAAKLFASIEPIVRSADMKPGHAELLLGDVNDEAARELRIDL